MEIITYMNPAYGNYGKRKPFLPFPKKKKHFRSLKAKSAKRAFAFKFKAIIALKKLGEYLWVLPVAALIVGIPLLANKAFDFAQSRANPLRMRGDNGVERALLNAAMERLMVSADDVDDDGNLASILPSVDFYEKVSFKEYTVRRGDTIGGITRKFGLGNVSTIIAVNNIPNVRQIASGQVLKIPSLDGLFYNIKNGDSLEKLGEKHSVSVEAILDANDLDTTAVTVGQKIFIPGARLDKETLKRAMGEIWIYPIRSAWRFTSGFGWRTNPVTGVGRQYHPGIDMACPIGTPVIASNGGRVVASNDNSRVYGRYVIIDHGNGYQTLYGHLSKRLVSKGDVVSQNQRIGLVGSTGYSTGPHLHFGIYKNGNAINPLTVLKKG